MWLISAGVPVLLLNHERLLLRERHVSRRTIRGGQWRKDIDVDSVTGSARL